MKRGGPEYQPVGQGENENDGFTDEAGAGLPTPTGPPTPRYLDDRAEPRNFRRWLSVQNVIIAVLSAAVLALGLRLVQVSSQLPGTDGHGHGSCPPPPPDVPQYFQTSPELWIGPTATGKAPFLAQTAVPGPAGTAGYVPNAPLQTAVPIDGMRPGNTSIFAMMGYLSPYAPSPGFGVDEHPLPDGAEIVQLQMLSRHGSRYPTTGSNVAAFGERIAKAKAQGRFSAEGELAFLNDWAYSLGHEVLVPKGRQELFDSGVLHRYMYGQLHRPGSRIVARTTTQHRMLHSAENFLAGFFGLAWPHNATIEVIIEDRGRAWNNSLAGYFNCPNARAQNLGRNASAEWVGRYLGNATDRLRALVGSGRGGFDWTVEDTYAAQTLCPYETVALGYSDFCAMFDYDDWRGFAHSVDLAFAGNDMFQSPTGRAVGLGYTQEVVARLRNRTLGYAGSQINTTLDGSQETFPLNQSLYLDFSHDTNIASVLAAFGLRQFAAPLLPTDRLPDRPHNLSVSHLTPFAARLDIELIRSPRPVPADRKTEDRDKDKDKDKDKAKAHAGGTETKYVHFVLNQRTVPLGWSLPACDAARVDGWCELETFVKAVEEQQALAQYDHACFGEYDPGKYGDVMDGAPPKKGK